jgi:FOG: HEAT repeat
MREKTCRTDERAGRYTHRRHASPILWISRLALISVYLLGCACRVLPALEQTKVSTQQLIKNLSSRDVALRADAAHDLARRKDKAAVPALLKALPLEPVESIRAQIVAAIANTRDRSAVPTLLKYLKARSPELRSSSLRALGVIGDKRAVHLRSRLFPTGLRSCVERRSPASTC